MSPATWTSTPWSVTRRGQPRAWTPAISRAASAEASTARPSTSTAPANGAPRSAWRCLTVPCQRAAAVPGPAIRQHAGHRRPGAPLGEPHGHDPPGVRRISTDPNPYAAAYTATVGEAVTSGRPSIVFFATPAFCQTGYCGPTIELVKTVAREYEDRVAFVNVEPYELHETVDGLRPVLDADGRLQPVAAARDYGIPVEPYLFLVDARGDVFAKFEGIVGGDELRAAIEDVLAEAP